MSYDIKSKPKVKADHGGQDIIEEPLLEQRDHLGIGRKLKVELDQLSDLITKLNSNISKYEQSMDRSSSIVQLEYINEQDERIRQQINELFKRISKEMKDIKENLTEYKEIPVNSQDENRRRLLEYNSMNRITNELAKKFETLAKRFKVKEEESIENTRTSYLGKKTPDVIDKSNQEHTPFGHFDEESQGQNLQQQYQQKQQISQKHQLNIREQAEIEQIEDYLKDREQQLNKVNKLMDGVLSIAKDIGAEVKLQGAKLEQVDTEMKGTEDNVKKGTEQLDQAKKGAIRSNKWIVGLFIGIAIFVLILILAIVLRRR